MSCRQMLALIEPLRMVWTGLLLLSGLILHFSLSVSAPTTGAFVSSPGP